MVINIAIIPYKRVNIVFFIFLILRKNSYNILYPIIIMPNIPFDLINTDNEMKIIDINIYL